MEYLNSTRKGAFIIGGNMTREEIEQYVWDYLKNKNLADEVISEIMGNIEAESEFNPDLVEVGNSIGFGLCQWSYERRDQLEAYGTSLTHQCNFLWSELTGENREETGAHLQWIPAKGYTYDKFINNQYSIEEGTKAFCWCFERPNEDYAHIDRRVKSAFFYFDKFGGTSSGGSESEKVEKAVQWLIDIANDDSHGYDQTYRWGEYGDYDCSSFIITGFEQAGIGLKTNGATYTGDMKSVALSIGFNEISMSDWNDYSQLKRGDIILNEHYHVACYIGNGQIVHASINELGTTTGGQAGDQTGKEICVRSYYVYSRGWDCVLRYKNGSSGGGGGGTTPDIPDIDDSNFEEYLNKYFKLYDDIGEVYKAIEKTPYILRALNSEYQFFLKTLSFNDNVHMNFTFNRNKMYIGKDFLGKRLKFDEKSYTIINVASKGFVVITYSGSECIKTLNPSLLWQTDEEKTKSRENIISRIKAHIKEEQEEQDNDN
ncbi:MAG: tail lysozyme [Bacteriophage sp.]|nr:MAG: tail lysozyme [Bacteriophage sp.]